MSLTKEIVQQENSRTTADRMEVHLHKEGTPFRRICNPAEVNISIYNAEKQLR